MFTPTDSVFEQVLLWPGDPGGADRLLLQWQAPDQGERLVQVYVNRRLYDVSPDPTCRWLWLNLAGYGFAEVQLLAVDPTQAWTNLAAVLQPVTPPTGASVVVSLPRDQSWPADSWVEVQLDGQALGGGPLWDSGDSRGGFGVLFGEGLFGFDDQPGAGFGLLAWGQGAFGTDQPDWAWHADQLPGGSHELQLRITDTPGRLVGTLQDPINLELAPAPAPPADLNVEPDFTLTWTG
jgi:hypothetical protein